MKRKLLLVFLVLFVSLYSAAQSASLAGEWRGIWTDPTGFIFTAQLTLENGVSCKTCTVIGDAGVRRKIVWTLRKVGSAGAEKYAGKVGTTATELVKGEIKGDGLLVLNGYEKDDPNNIIAIDEYRLAIADTRQVVGGITRNNGSWTGQFIAVRAQP